MIGVDFVRAHAARLTCLFFARTPAAASGEDKAEADARSVFVGNVRAEGQRPGWVAGADRREREPHEIAEKKFFCCIH